MQHMHGQARRNPQVNVQARPLGAVNARVQCVLFRLPRHVGRTIMVSMAYTLGTHPWHHA